MTLGRLRGGDAAETIGALQQVRLREIWKHEARDFSTWLAAHLGLLAPVLGLTLSDPQREVRIGDFAADIVATDARGRRVVIENQLELSDHAHLGQALTYMAGLDARVAVWITPTPRTEHVQAVRWMNVATAPDRAWYLVKVEAVRIGRSPVAAIFTRVAGPADTTVRVGLRDAPPTAPWWRRGDRSGMGHP